MHAPACHDDSRTAIRPLRLQARPSALMPKLPPPPLHLPLPPIIGAAMGGQILAGGSRRGGNVVGGPGCGCGARPRLKRSLRCRFTHVLGGRRCGCEGFEHHAGRACRPIAAMGGCPHPPPPPQGRPRRRLAGAAACASAGLQVAAAPTRCCRCFSSRAGQGTAGSGRAARAQRTAIQPASRARPRTRPRSAQTTPRWGRQCQ